MDNEYLTDEQLAEKVAAAKATTAMESQAKEVQSAQPIRTEPTEVERNVNQEEEGNNSSAADYRPFEQSQKQYEKPVEQSSSATDFSNYRYDYNDNSSIGNENGNEKGNDLSNLLAPLTVRGRPFTPRSVEELRALAQKGVAFTQKSQELASDRKYLRVLEEHGLKDFNKLSFAVDLFNRKPEALAKFFKDNNLDPIDIDIEQARNYQPTNVAGNPAMDKFEMVVDTIKSDVNGENFLTDLWSRINSDEETKKNLVENPRLLANIYNAKRTGLYDTVIAELDREELYDPISQSEPFLSRFERIGKRYIARQQEIQRQQAEAASVQQLAQQQYMRNAYPAGGVFSSSYVPPRVPLAIGKSGSYSNLDETARRLISHNRVGAEIPKKEAALTDAQLQALIRSSGIYNT